MKLLKSKLEGKKPKKCQRFSLDGRKCLGNGYLDSENSYYAQKPVCLACWKNLKYIAKRKGGLTKPKKVVMFGKVYWI